MDTIALKFASIYTTVAKFTRARDNKRLHLLRHLDGGPEFHLNL